jgi:hypothetical protein
MKDLPNRCICGYQGKIDRLEKELEHFRDIAKMFYNQRNEWHKGEILAASEAYVEALRGE